MCLSLSLWYVVAIVTVTLIVMYCHGLCCFFVAGVLVDVVFVLVADGVGFVYDCIALCVLFLLL